MLTSTSDKPINAQNHRLFNSFLDLVDKAKKGIYHDQTLYT